MADVSIADVNNSTTTPLGASGVFTGSFTDLSDYSSVSVMIFSDVGSAPAGLKFQWSTDGVNIDDEQSHSYAGSLSEGGKFLYAGVRSRFFRLTYTNTAEAQTTFRLQTLLRRGPIVASIAPAGDAIVNNSDGFAVQAIGYGKDISAPTNNPVFFKTGPDALSLIVEHPLNRNTIQESVKSQSTSSQQFDFFGLFGGSRRWMSVYNNSDANLFLRLANAATLTDWFVKLGPGCFWELPIAWGMFSGTLHGIWDAAGSGTAQIVEVF